MLTNHGDATIELMIRYGTVDRNVNKLYSSRLQNNQNLLAFFQIDTIDTMMKIKKKYWLGINCIFIPVANLIVLTCNISDIQCSGIFY